MAENLDGYGIMLRLLSYTDDPSVNRQIIAAKNYRLSKLAYVELNHASIRGIKSAASFANRP